MDKKYQILLKQARASGNLSLANQKLKEIPNEVENFSELVLDDQKWWELNSLTKIDLSYNMITHVANSFSKEKGLQVIRLAHNKIESLDENCFEGLEFLKLLDLTNNKLQKFPNCLNSCISIVDLELSGNKIEKIDIPDSLKNLEILNINNNSLIEMPFLQKFQILKKIDLSKNSIPEIVEPLPNSLIELKLDSNKITYIDKGILNGLSNLVQLDLSTNKLTQIFDLPSSSKLDSVNLAFNSLENISELNVSKNCTSVMISNNKLKELPPDILKMPNLTTLDISNNDINMLPAELGLMKKLVRISLEGNPLRAQRNLLNIKGAMKIKQILSSKLAPTKEEEEEQKNSVSSLRNNIYNHEISLSSSSLKEIPLEIYSHSLETYKMDLSKNQLTSLDIQLSNFQNIIELNLNENNLQIIPEFFQSLKSLKNFSMKRNKLTEIKGLPDNLERLDLSWNRMGFFPNIISKLNKLYYLELSGNAIDKLGSLPMSLIEIFLNDNKINEIDEILKIEGVEVLSLENNDLSVIPTLLGFKSKIRVLKLEGNPQKMIRRQILEKGSIAVMEYLKSRHVP